MPLKAQVAQGCDTEDEYADKAYLHLSGDVEVDEYRTAAHRSGEALRVASRREPLKPDSLVIRHCTPLWLRRRVP